MKRRAVRLLTLPIAAALAGLVLAASPASADDSPDDPWPDSGLLQFTSPSGNLTDEPSGLAASRLNPGTFFWQNEAPRNGGGMVYAVDPDGRVKSFWFSPAGSGRPAATSLDFEDMAAGPCDGRVDPAAPEPGCLWVGDIGRVSADFPASTKNVFWLYRMAEPDVSASPNGTRLQVTGRFPFTLPDAIAEEGRLSGGSGTTYDMEALMVHPQTGEVFVVTKGKNTAGLIRILRYPMPMQPGVVQELEVVKTFQMPRSSDWNPATLAGQGNHLVTGADIHPDGNRFLLRTYGRIWEFRGRTFAEALASAAPVRLARPGGALDHQGEAVAYASDGSGYATLAEYSRTITRSVCWFPL